MRFVFTNLRRLWQNTSATATLGTTRGSIPADTRVYAIGDVHGRLDLLQQLERRIVADAAAHPGPQDQRLILVGDYVDRGPDSRGVLEHLCRPPPRAFTRTLLRGNHDWWMQRFVEGDGPPLPWLVSGGDAALRSYGVDPSGPLATAEQVDDLRRRLARRMPVAHRRVLGTLLPSVEVGTYLFVHAGIRPGLPLAQQSAYDLMFMREPFLSDTSDHGMIVVHGHTVTSEPVVRSNRIGIDTGAFWSNRLTALVVEHAGIRFLSTDN